MYSIHMLLETDLQFQLLEEDVLFFLTIKKTKNLNTHRPTVKLN